MGEHLLQDVRVLDVRGDGDDVVASVYGGPEHVCASVRFTFPDVERRRRIIAQLRRWADEERAVALVTRGSTVALVDDRRVVDRLVGSGAEG